MGIEDPSHFPVHPLKIGDLSVERHGQRHIAISDAVNLELNQGVVQAADLGAGGAVLQGSVSGLLLLHVGHQRKAPGEVVALGGADPLAGRLLGLPPPFEADGEGSVQPVEIGQQIGLCLDGWGESE